MAVISHGLFSRRFGGDRTVLGRTILLSGRPHTVIGVMPREFAIPEEEVEIWTPIAFGPERSLDAHYLGVTARLALGVTYEQSPQTPRRSRPRCARPRRGTMRAGP